MIKEFVGNVKGKMRLLRMDYSFNEREEKKNDKGILFRT